MTNQKIAVVFESFVRAGSQRHLLEILKGLHVFRPEIECKLFLIAPADHRWGTFLPEIMEAGIPVEEIPYIYRRRDGLRFWGRANNWVSRHWRERRLNRPFYAKLKNFHVIVCAQPFVADLLLPHLRPNQRLCFHLSEHISQRPTHNYYRLLRDPRVHIIFQHHSQIDQLPSTISFGHAITWPLRLCPDHFVDPIEVKPDPAGVLRVVHYSRISPMRFVDKVINAFAELHSVTASTLRIAGFVEDPEYYHGLLAQIDHLGISDSVHFVDPVPVPVQDSARAETDLVWMISISGHIGYAGIESMAAGMPTLLLEVDSLAHNTHPESNLSDLISPTSTHLVKRSLAVMADPKRFLQEQSQFVRKTFMTTSQSIDILSAFYLGQIQAERDERNA